MLAKINRNNHGVADFEAHAINISGGTMPNIVSEAKKKLKIACGEYFATKSLSMLLKSKINNSNPTNTTTNNSITNPPLNAVSFRNE
jgi:hypothetical protein